MASTARQMVQIYTVSLLSFLMFLSGFQGIYCETNGSALHCLTVVFSDVSVRVPGHLLRDKWFSFTLSYCCLF